MIKQQICPHCRSVFEINGALDFLAKSIQSINCPVCGQEIWVDSGFWPQKWTVGKIIVKEYNPAPPEIISQPIPAESAKPVWSDFSILGSLSGIGDNIKKIAIWIVIVLALIAIIKFKK